MTKAEKFIQDYTNHCSNEIEGGGYHEWLTPKQARRAVEIAKEEMLKEFEKNRLKHCNSITNEQAELEQGFIDQHIDKYQRMPTFLDAIEYGMRLQKEQMMKEAGYEWDAEKKELKKIEQKPSDKVEPKFHKGEWINGYYTNYKVLSVNNDGYVVEDVDGNKINILFENEKFHHLFTIADAKDGDVLVCESGWTCIFKTLVNDENFSSYCFMDNTKWFCETGSECHTLKGEFVKAYNGKIYPATKEQRSLLFQKMKEAGYVWDAEKKELKKIEQNSASAWSEDDDDNMLMIEDRLSDYLDYIREDSSLTKHRKNSLKEEVIGYVKWLKSLKDRCTWKPSEDKFAHIVGCLVQDVVANEHMPEEEKQPTKFFVEKYYKKLREE